MVSSTISSSIIPISYTSLSLGLHSHHLTTPHLIDRDIWILDFEATNRMTLLNTTFNLMSQFPKVAKYSPQMANSY